MRTNRTFDDLKVGATEQIARVVTPDDLYIFAHVSGNLNPVNLPGSAGDGPDDVVHPAPAMWLGSLFSAVLGNLLPGPGTLYCAQSLTFLGRAHVGETLTVRVTVTEKRPPQTVVLQTHLLRGDDLIVEGFATVLAPLTSATINDSVLPELMVARHRQVARLLAACRELPPLTTAVVAPEDANSLAGALAGARNGLITPILIGDAGRISDVADKCGLSLRGLTVLNVPSHDGAAARAVELVHAGEAAAIMKGNLHTDELLRHVVKSQGGLRGTRRHQPCLRDGRSGPAGPAAGKRRRDQHRPRAEGEDRHHAERDRSRAGVGHRGAEGGHPVRGARFFRFRSEHVSRSTEGGGKADQSDHDT